MSFPEYLIYSLTETSSIGFDLVLRNALVSELDNVAKLSDKCNIQIPMEVIKWVCLCT